MANEPLPDHAEADFPAAHSMDLCWYAVDKDGHVGVFESGSDGMVPEGVEEGMSPRLLAQLQMALGLAEEIDLDDETQLDWDAHEEDYTALGFYYYEFSRIADGVYSRGDDPANPLHVDQLPPTLRKLFKGIRLRKASFAECEMIQPVEHIACAFYGMAVAYVASDGVTVRPVPGQEANFADYCRHFHEENPKEAAKYRFEPPIDPEEEDDE